MASAKRNEYLDHGPSDESDNDAGYDSEAAEISKTRRASKRRKIDQEPANEEADQVEPSQTQTTEASASATQRRRHDEDEDEDEDENENAEDKTEDGSFEAAKTQTPKRKKKDKTKDKETVPGVIYLSSLPPYLKPSALRNLLEQRGFSPIKRLFLSPASKHKSGSKKNSRRLYTEGWIEFASKKTARRCAEALNTQVVGGRKGGFYHDDIWNMKYLKGMQWEELMAGIREEKREEEGRRDEERRIIARETKRFIEGVEEGRKREGMKRKRELKGVGQDADADSKRTWRQVEVKGQGQNSLPSSKEGISDDVKAVLGKIF